MARLEGIHKDPNVTEMERINAALEARDIYGMLRGRANYRKRRPLAFYKDFAILKRA
jgi:hypothetical protein